MIVAGGYANSRGVVVTYMNEDVDDLSYLVQNDMTYVNWIAIHA